MRYGMFVAWGAVGALAALSTMARAEQEQGVDIPENLSQNGYVWSTNSGHSGTFLYDNTPPTSWDEFYASPISEFTWNDVRHSGPSIQWTHMPPDQFGTQFVFSGGQTGENWFSLQFQTQAQINPPTRPESFAYNNHGDEPDPIDWLGVQFLWTGAGGLVHTEQVTQVIKPYFMVIENTPPSFLQARVNGIDGHIVLDEKVGNHTLTLDALATDAEGGVLSFTIDGDGPVAAAATGAGSTRLSHTLTRTISGASTGDDPHEFVFLVEDPTYGWARITRTVSVRNLDPIITAFEVNPAAPEAGYMLGDLLTFSADATDPGGDPLTFAWDLTGNGAYDDHLGPSGSLLLEDPTLTRISVRVDDGDGGFAVQHHDFIVIPEPGTLGLLALGLGLLGVRRR